MSAGFDSQGFTSAVCPQKSGWGQGHPCHSELRGIGVKEGNTFVQTRSVSVTEEKNVQQWDEKITGLKRGFSTIKETQVFIDKVKETSGQGEVRNKRGRVNH